VEQQLQQSKENTRLMDIGVLEEDYSSEWSSENKMHHGKTQT
jgi:hypothetical protein